MRSIAVINQKGGAGKTTTAVNLSDALAREGRRVLLVDLDPQSHSSLHLGVQLGDGEAGVYDVLMGDSPAAEAMRSVSERLCLLPAGIDLVGAELELRGRPNWERALRDVLRPYRETFDFCLIDCPPSLGQLTVSALVAAEEVIIPLQPHFLALQGLGRLLETIALVRQELNPGLQVSGVALCMFEKGTRLAQEVFEDVQRFLDSAERGVAWYGARLFDAKIRRNIKLAECPSYGQTIFAYAPASNGAEDYQALALEVLALVNAAATDISADEQPVTKDMAEITALPGAPQLVESADAPVGSAHIVVGPAREREAP
jgi:chromosome partitioning protein